MNWVAKLSTEFLKQWKWIKAKKRKQVKSFKRVSERGAWKKDGKWKPVLEAKSTNFQKKWKENSLNFNGVYVYDDDRVGGYCVDNF